MSIIPTRVQEQVSRVDRTRSLWFGLSAGATALWSLYRVFWLIYATGTFQRRLHRHLAGLPARAVGRDRGRRGAVVFLLRYSNQP